MSFIVHEERIAVGDNDFALQNHGSICILQPLSEAALRWLEDHVLTDETQLWGASGVVIEPRYVETIVAGIYGDGLTVLGLKPHTIN